MAENRTYFLPILICALLAGTTQAGLSAADSENIRTGLVQQIPQCDQVAENAAQMLEKFPQQETEIVAEWREICPNSTEIQLYALVSQLSSIDARSPALNPDLWNYLRNSGKHEKRKEKSAFQYWLKKRAALAKPASVDGKALQTFFTDGYTSFRSELARSNSGRLRELYLEERTRADAGLSFSMGLSTGAWLPTGNLARMGNHPALGFQFLAGYGRFSAGFLFDFRFLKTPAEYTYFNRNSNSLETTTTFFGLFFGPDVRWEFLSREQFSVFLVAGMGYDIITHYAAARYSRESPAFSDSLNLNAGLAFRYYVQEERTFYLELDLRYHRARFSDGGKGGDDLSGNYYTAWLAWGYRISFGSN